MIIIYILYRFEVVVPSKRASSGPVIERYIGEEHFHRLQDLFPLLPEQHQTQLRYQAQNLWKAVGVAYVMAALLTRALARSLAHSLCLTHTHARTRTHTHRNCTHTVAAGGTCCGRGAATGSGSTARRGAICCTGSA